MNWKALLFILIVGFGAYQSWQKHEVVHGLGVTAPQIPSQQATKNTGPIILNGYRIEPLEDFSIMARVLSSEHYSMDRGAALSPVDLALGWGPMSDESVLSDIRIRQSNRWYHWQTDGFPIPRREIETNSANMHMIPATDQVERQLKAIKKGQLVKIKGYLVEARADDGWRWRSSLTRDDTGAGACELVLVESISVL